ncbi:hypothetical protein P170DRAFT_327512, partial [Aspergillus steynii IBT 23096]
FIKSVLGMLKLNIFLLPKIIYNILFIFSPHVLLFSILFYIYIFKVTYLTLIKDLRRLLIK